MTYQGAIDELKSLENNESMPDWFKPTLKKVRETMEMDRKETLDDVRAEIVKAYEDATMYSCDEELSRFASRVCGILSRIGKPESEE